MRALEDAVSLRGLLDAGPIGRALVVGTDYLGLEMAAALVHQCIYVVLVELTDRVLGTVDPPLVDPVSDEVRRHGVDLRLRTALTEVRSTTSGLSATTGGRSATVDAVIVAVGAQPAARLAAVARAATGLDGALLVDDSIRTGPFAGVVGTALVKVLHLAMVRTGLTLGEAETAGLSAIATTAVGKSRATYYPRTDAVHVRLVQRPGRVLGAQLVGGGGNGQADGRGRSRPPRRPGRGRPDRAESVVRASCLCRGARPARYEPVLLAAQAAAA